MRNLFKFKKWAVISGLGLWFIVCISSTSYARGIRVSPGAFCLQGIDVGTDTDLGIDLVITNLGSDEEIFTVKPLRPSQAKERWLKGYSEIPDPTWLYFKEDKIVIGPNGEGRLRMHLKIPDEERYLNQHWMVYLEVTTETRKGEMFRVGIKPNYMIETRSKENIKERPYGLLGLAPSTLRVTGVVPGKKRWAYFRIYNNDKFDHTYTLSSYIPKKSSEKQDISISPGYEWVGDTDWIRPSRTRITLLAGEVKYVDLDVVVPEGAKYQDLGWEAIVLIEPDEGLSGFVRVLITGEEEHLE